jgi:hypothetical protein
MSMTLPSAEQVERARWDLILRDLEHRAEQVRQMKAFEGRRLAIQAIGATAAVFIAGTAVGALLLNTLSRPPTITVHLDQPLKLPPP